MVKTRLTRLSPLSLHLCFGVAAALPTGVLRAQTPDPMTQEAAKDGGIRVSPPMELSATNVESQWLGASTENTGSYAPGTTTMGGKGPQKLREIPQSVTVITDQRLQDQQLRNMDQVMNQMTGVTRKEAWAKNTYVSRGFEINDVRYEGGATSSMLDSSRYEDLAQFDSVGLLRGADGLYGAGEPGGVINFSYKRPLSQPQVKTLTSPAAGTTTAANSM